MSPSSGQTEDRGRYFDRREEGWFWYEPEPEPVPEIAPKEAEKPAAAPAPEIDVAAPAEATADEPKPLSAAWFRANLDDYRDRALDDPSPENVEAYLYLQRIALERAGGFAEASTAAAARDPWLDANSERPIATYAAQAIDALAEGARNAVLRELARETGILFFYRADCPLCDSQAGVLKLAGDVHGFEIVAVSLDGSPPAGGLEAHRLDDGQADHLGVAALPATFLIRPPDLIAPLAQAPLDLQTLGRRIIGQAHALGLVPEETYLATRAVRRPFNLPTDFDDLPPEILDDPARLVAHIRQKVGMANTGTP
ncbi:MAG: conjugal transfer protein TraF [Alphaproteobacteria bacterium]